MVSFVMKSKIPGSNLINRFGQKQGQKKYKAERVFTFIVYFLGKMVFPKRIEEGVHTRLVTIFDALCNGYEKGPCTIVPMVIAEIYQVFSCCKNGPSILRGVTCYYRYG